MEFLTTSQSPAGPPAMDLEEPRDTLSPSQDLPPSCQWDPVPRRSGSLGQMELDGPSIEDLVPQFEALPGDLVGLSPDGPPCPLHMATGHGLASGDIADGHGLLSAEAGRDDLLSLLHCQECPPSQSCPKEPPDPAPRPLQPPEDPDGDTSAPEWAEGASAERGWQQELQQLPGTLAGDSSSGCSRRTTCQYPGRACPAPQGTSAARNQARALSPTPLLSSSRAPRPRCHTLPSRRVSVPPTLAPEI